MQRTEPREKKTETLVLNLGPQHPSTHGVLHVIVELDGEMIVNADAVIGYLHRGIEKLAEHRTYASVVPLLNRCDYLAPFVTEWAYTMAVEQLGGYEVPPRAEYLRVIMGELTRIASHLLWLTAYGLDLGAYTPMFYCIREREKILDLFEAMSGNRMMPNYCRPGGVKEDAPPGWLERVSAFASDFPRYVDQYEALLTTNEVFVWRTRNINSLTTEEALTCGLTGPLVRATGAPRDLRKDSPYSVYNDLDFEVAVGEKGDCFARYAVRIAEMRQSARILGQAVAAIPDGEVRGKVPKAIKPPEGEAYVRMESPRGLLGVYLVSDGSASPYKLHLRAPSLINLSAMPKLLYGWKVADAIAIIGSLDIVLGEIDR